MCVGREVRVCNVCRKSPDARVRIRDDLGVGTHTLRSTDVVCSRDSEVRRCAEVAKGRYRCVVRAWPCIEGAMGSTVLCGPVQIKVAWREGEWQMRRRPARKQQTGTYVCARQVRPAGQAGHFHDGGVGPETLDHSRRAGGKGGRGGHGGGREERSQREISESSRRILSAGPGSAPSGPSGTADTLSCSPLRLPRGLADFSRWRLRPVTALLVSCETCRDLWEADRQRRRPTPPSSIP